MNKDNILWKLDLLEVHYLHRQPRLPRTKLLLKAKHKKLALLKLKRDEAQVKIDEFKSQLCERKIHASVLKLNSVLKKVMLLERSKLGLKLKSNKEDEKLVKQLLLIQDIDADLVTHGRLIRLITKVYLINAKQVATMPLFLPSWCREAIIDVDNKYNPKYQFKSNSQEMNDLISKFWNHKDCKSLVEEVEISLGVILGPVEKKKSLSVKVEVSDNESDEESVSDSSDEEVSDEELDLDKYKDMVIYEEDEGDDEELQFQIDPNVNYSEITDEEPSDLESESEEEDMDAIYEERKLNKRKLENDDFFDFEQAEKKTEKKVKLPALQAGYFSGGESDDSSDIDNDKVVKLATSQRKNRRGQRARQKIWELKYGSKAKHVEKEKLRVQSEREKRQKEYQERVRKRAEKLKLLLEQGGTGSNQTPLSKMRTHVPSKGKPQLEPVLEKPLHPSWEAKLKAQLLLKNQKFSGKKIVFD